MCTQPFHVLVVDDEPQMWCWLQTGLKAHGYQVIEASNGQDALIWTITMQLDMILLDLDLPDLQRLEVVRRICESSTVPIIAVSVRRGDWEKIAALDMEELLASIRATIRHRLHATSNEPVFRSAALTVDLGRRIVLLGQAEVKLTPTQYELLRVLVLHAGHVVTHHDLLREVWGPDAAHHAVPTGTHQPNPSET